MQLYFGPLIDAFNSLYSKGIEVHTQEGPKVVRAKVLTCVIAISNQTTMNIIKILHMLNICRFLESILYCTVSGRIIVCI